MCNNHNLLTIIKLNGPLLSLTPLAFSGNVSMNKFKKLFLETQSFALLFIST